MARRRQTRVLWTPTDMKTLRKLAGRQPIEKIAKELKRTVAAVRFKAHMESIPLAVKRRAA